MKIEKYYNLTADVPYERVSKERILTGFNDLDYFTKGMGAGVTLLVANTNAGKSTFVQGVLAKAIEQGYKSFVFSGEHTAQDFLQLLYHQNSEKKDYVPIRYKDTNIIDWYVTPEKETELKAKFDGKIFIYSNKAKRDIDTMLDSMKACYAEMGTRFYLIDNMISIDNITSNVFAEQTKITEAIRTFALNTKVIVLLVAHQRKSAEKGGFLIDVQDVAGSLNISNKAYNIIAQYRTDMLPQESKDYERLKGFMSKFGFDLAKCDGVLQVLKEKGNGYGFVGINYDKETKTYRQAQKISKIEADKLFAKSERKQQSLSDLLPVEDSESLPF